MELLSTLKWQNSLEGSLDIILTKFIEYIPNILGAIFLLLAGYFISKIIAGFFKKFSEL